MAGSRAGSSRSRSRSARRSSAWVGRGGGGALVPEAVGPGEAGGVGGAEVASKWKRAPREWVWSHAGSAGMWRSRWEMRISASVCVPNREFLCLGTPDPSAVSPQGTHKRLSGANACRRGNPGSGSWTRLRRESGSVRRHSTSISDISSHLLPARLSAGRVQTSVRGKSLPVARCG